MLENILSETPCAYLAWPRATKLCKIMFAQLVLLFHDLRLGCSKYTTPRAKVTLGSPDFNSFRSAKGRSKGNVAPRTDQLISRRLSSCKHKTAQTGCGIDAHVATALKFGVLAFILESIRTAFVPEQYKTIFYSVACIFSLN